MSRSTPRLGPGQSRSKPESWSMIGRCRRCSRRKCLNLRQHHSKVHRTRAKLRRTPAPSHAKSHHHGKLAQRSPNLARKGRSEPLSDEFGPSSAKCGMYLGELLAPGDGTNINRPNVYTVKEKMIRDQRPLAGHSSSPRPRDSDSLRPPTHFKTPLAQISSKRCMFVMTMLVAHI